MSRRTLKSAARALVGLLPAEEAPFDELLDRRLRARIAEARRTVHTARAARMEAAEALAQVGQPLERAIAASDLLKPAEERSRLASAAESASRRAALQTGAPVDAALVAAAELAEGAVREAARAQAAAREALPELQKRVEAAEEALARADDGIARAIAGVLVATLAQRVAGARAAAAQLSAHYRELAAVDCLMVYGQVPGLRGSVPSELIPPPPTHKFTPEDLVPSMAPWRDLAQRLRDDPEATLNE